MKKQLTGLLAMLLILAGCNNNDDALPVQHVTENTGIKGHFKDFPELESLFDKAMPKNNSGHGNAKAKAVGIYDFKIDSTFITKRVGPKGTSYTMAIYRDSTYKFIENLIICDRGNFTEAYIMSYFPENEFEKKENAQYHFIGGMSLAKIDYGKVPKSGLGCASVTVTYCDWSRDGTPNTHVAGPNCGTTYNITTTLCHGILTSDYFNPEMQPMQFIRATRGSGGGSSSNPTPPNSPDFNIITQPQLTLSEAALFSRSLSATQKVFWNNSANATLVARLKNYLNSKNYSSESKSFVKTICDFQIATSNTTLTNKLLTLANNDIESAQQIIDYLSNEGNSAASQTFATWATTYYQNHPETTAEQFNNWFMGESEGQDGNYNATYWDNPTLTFPQQNLPTWQQYYDAFPKGSSGEGLSGPEIYSLVGGQPLAMRNGVLNDSDPTNNENYNNACALRVSRALNYSGIIIPNITNQTFLGDDGKYYFLGARNLNKWMRKTFGTNDGDSTTPHNDSHFHYTALQAGTNGQNLPTLLQGKKGIFSMVTQNSWASGHADALKDDGTCVNNCHFYDAPIIYIDIWELN